MVICLSLLFGFSLIGCSNTENEVLLLVKPWNIQLFIISMCIRMTIKMPVQ